MKLWKWPSGSERLDSTALRELTALPQTL